MPINMLSSTATAEDREAQRPSKRFRLYRRVSPDGPSSSTRRPLLHKITERSIFLVIAILFAIAAVGVASGDWQIRPILSGSMRPGFPIGGIVVTKRMPLSALQVGDVAVLHPPSDPQIEYAHRVIYLRHEGSTDVIRTKGDDNLYRDPWTLRVSSRYVYIAQFTVPLLGYPAVWAHSPSGRLDMLIVAAVLAILFVASLVPGRSGRKPRPRRPRRGMAAGEDAAARGGENAEGL